MADEASDIERAGVRLLSDGAYAVVVRADHSLVAPRVATGPARLEAAVSAAVQAARSLRSVTLDLSDVLLGAVERATPQAPRVAVIRIVPRAATEPVLGSSPAVLLEGLIARRFSVGGGHDLLGNELRPLDLAELAAICAELRRTEIRRIAVVAAGSQAQPHHERDVADAIQAALPDARISVASDMGGQGLVAREATVILNCSLADLVGRVLARCERVLAKASPNVELRVARGDGGYGLPSQIRALPALALGATDALQLCGAAHQAGLEDCRVVLQRPGGPMAGDVRHGLAVVRPAELAGIGTELVVPTAVLSPHPDQSSRKEAVRPVDVPVVVDRHDPLRLGGIGAAVSRPTAWLDEVAFIESAAELERVRSDAEDRAAAIVIANGGAPGSTKLAEVSTVAVPYSPSGTVRIRVRVVGDPALDAVERAVPARATR